jgi:tRNA A-37 threonylcarbamoyl transferase component Bud32
MTAAPSFVEGAEATACPSDETFARLLEGALPEERVRALQAHADDCAACGRALAELARTLAPDASEREEWVDGRYRVLRPLGAGSMGVVAEAFDTKLRRKVAIKRLREPDAGEGRERRRARFLREARLLASLSHPNLLVVHDVGEVEGELYVVMELIDGRSMARWLAEASPPLPWRAIVGLYVAAGRGLAAAHALGVVHRDVKPENVLVATNGRVLVGDFGLAGLTVGSIPAMPPVDAAADLTETGVVLGTPAYMAPEIHDGRPADARSDQYSFCTSLWESLHGRRPFEGRTAGEVVAAARRGRLPLGRDGVPRAIDRVLAVGLAASPERRHASMEALLAALARGESAHPPRAAIVTAAVAGLAGLALVAAKPAAPPPPAPPAVAPSPAPVAAPAPPEAPWLERPAARVPREIRRARVLAPPGADPGGLLLLADGAFADRDGASCLAALGRMPAGAWPAALEARATRRRATCQMLTGACDGGRRLLERVDGADAARAALLASCPPRSLATVDDRLAAVAAQADEARYAGNVAARRRALQAELLREAAAPGLARCVAEPTSARACARRLSALARAYQVVAESFFAAGDCADGVALDVLHSQVALQSLGSWQGDPAVGCRAPRAAEMYRSCAPLAREAERRCLARVRAP